MKTYTSQVRKVLTWLGKNRRLDDLRTESELVERANAYLDQLHAERQPNSGVATALRAFLRFVADTRELE